MQTETWVICRLLATLAKAGALSYPLSLEHDDRPDFLLTLTNTRVGVEVTEAIPADYAAYSALAEREFPDTLLEPGHFRPSAPRRTADQKRQLLRQGRLSAHGWAGDEAEQDWAKFMVRQIERKLRNLAQPLFRRFDGNWLAIYDNLPLPRVNRTVGIDMLKDALSTRPVASPTFDAIFIERGSSIFRIAGDTTECFDLNDLWD